MPVNLHRLVLLFFFSLSATAAPLSRIIDAHMHIVGIGTDNSGCYLNPNQNRWQNPFNALKTAYMISASGINDRAHADREFVAYLDSLISTFPGPQKYYGLIFAFAPTYTRENNKIDYEKSGIVVPNQYVLQIAKEHPQMIPVGSLHPYQIDLRSEMTRLVASGVRLLKILPNSMNFDPSDEKTEDFFAELAKTKMVLIAHVGDEHSVSGGGITNAHGNPLLYEKWLKKYPTLKIIFAHVGSEGSSPTATGAEKENFSLVLGLLHRYPLQVYADVSAFSIAFKRIGYLRQLLLAKDIHRQLIFGSDYPLPNFTPLVVLALVTFRWYGLIDSSTMFALLKTQRSNPLAYNFELLRQVRYQGQGFPDGLFYDNFIHIFSDRPLPSALQH